TTAALGGVVSSTGQTVAGVGDALKDGLGQIGVIENPVGVTLTGVVGGGVNDTGNIVTSAGKLVQSVGTGPLAPLNAVTSPVGGLVVGVGETVSSAGGTLAQVVGTGPVEQLTSSL